MNEAVLLCYAKTYWLIFSTEVNVVRSLERTERREYETARGAGSCPRLNYEDRGWRIVLESAFDKLLDSYQDCRSGPECGGKVHDSGGNIFVCDENCSQFKLRMLVASNRRNRWVSVV